MTIIKKGFDDIMLNIIGWAISISSGYRIIKIVLFDPLVEIKEMVIPLIVLGAVCLFGIILVWLTIKKAGSTGWEWIKKVVNKKIDNEKTTD